MIHIRLVLANLLSLWMTLLSSNAIAEDLNLIIDEDLSLVVRRETNIGDLRIVMAAKGELTLRPSTGGKLISTSASAPSFDTLSTIVIAQPEDLEVGSYDLVCWSGLQPRDANGYGRPAVRFDGELNEHLVSEVVYLPTRIVLNIRRKGKVDVSPLVIWPVGDSITEGFNPYNHANYRVPLMQKLALLGYETKTVGIWKRCNTETNSFDASGFPIDNEDWQYHSGVRSQTLLHHDGFNSALIDNIDAGLDQAGDPDVVLLHIGTNDGYYETAEDTLAGITNVVGRILGQRERTKVVVSTILPLPSSKVGLNKRIDAINDRLRKLMQGSSEYGNFPSDRVFLADLSARLPNDSQHYVSDGVHPNWNGHDVLSDAWLVAITNAFPREREWCLQSQIRRPRVEKENQGAEARNELDDYRKGFVKLAVLSPDSCQHYSYGPMSYDWKCNQYADETRFVRVGYYMELVRKGTHAHRWVWADMNSWHSRSFNDIGFPTELTSQQVVTNLHVCSNVPSIGVIPPDEKGSLGYIEFSPHDYTRNAFGTEGGVGAPKKTQGYDWNDKMLATGSGGSFQIHRILCNARNPAEVVMAYNGWGGVGTKPTVMGIGNFSQSLIAPGSIDYTLCASISGMSLEAFEVANIEIWGVPEPDPIVSLSEKVFVEEELLDDRVVAAICPASDSISEVALQCPSNYVGTVMVPSTIRKIKGVDPYMCKIVCQGVDVTSYMDFSYETSGYWTYALKDEYGAQPKIIDVEFPKAQSGIILKILAILGEEYSLLRGDDVGSIETICDRVVANSDIIVLKDNRYANEARQSFFRVVKGRSK